VKISKGEFKTGIETGFKEAWKSIKEGDKNYKAGRGTYDIARDHYLFAQQYNSENAHLNYKLGVCYLFTDDKYRAIDYLRKAYALDTKVSKDIHYLLGQAFQLVLEFDKAVDHYKMHMEVLSSSYKNLYGEVLEKRMEECKHGKELALKPVRVILKNPGTVLNSKYDDYNPVFAFGDTALFFTSRRPFEKARRNELDNKYNEDIYLSRFSDRVFSQAIRLDKPFNTQNNDAVVGVAPNGKRILLYRGHMDGGGNQITEFHVEKQKWSKPKRPKGKNLISKQGETSACFSPDMKELYYISRNKDLSVGAKDILLSRLNSKGKWDKPVNAGANLNTPYDEEGVFISQDGNYMYFSSQGHNSMGGFDVFRTERKEDGSWSDPVNLGYPINTPDDELFYITDQAGSTGYYSTIREGGIGSKDIYKVIYLGSEKELVFRTREELVAGPGQVKTGFLTLPALIPMDTDFVLKGRVFDSIGELQAVGSELIFIDPATGRQDASVNSDSVTGEYTASLSEAKVYGVEIHAEGYLYFLDILDLSTESSDHILRRDFYLQEVEVGTKVVLDNIYFQTGKAVLMPESNDELDQVFRFLENNPSITLEISGHTDNTGSLRINQRLSRDRARAVVDYLVGRGISEDLLISEGYADTQPVASNDTSDGRRQNRRVEFKVLSK
jgi:outer membrane protein OmpA-like peptidoglycan-associated protein/tetratricopeptide (TPR) repeat protein